MHRGGFFLSIDRLAPFSQIANSRYDAVMLTTLILACTLQADGVAPAAVPDETVSTSSVTAIDETRVAVVTGTGIIRIVELETGEALVETRAHAGNRSPKVSVFDDRHVLVHDASGRAVLRETATMEGVASYEPAEASERLAVSGNAASIAVRTSPGTIETVTLADEVEISTLEHEDDVRRVTFSPDGRRLALLCDGRVLVTDEAKSAIESTISFETGLAPSAFAFLDTDLIAVGFGEPRADQPDVFVQLYSVASGDVVRTLRAPLHLAPLSGVVTSIEYDAPSRTLVYGISSAGSLVAFDLDTGRVAWSVPGTGGNPNGVGISYRAGSRYACVSGGRSHTRSRVLDWTVGLEYGAHAFSGCHSLASTRGDRFIVGVRPAGSLDGTPGLAVFDAMSFEPLYTRLEGRESLSGVLVPAAN